MGNKTLTTFVFHRKTAELMAKTREKAAINANSKAKCLINLQFQLKGVIHNG